MNNLQIAVVLLSISITVIGLGFVCLLWYVRFLNNQVQEQREAIATLAKGIIEFMLSSPEVQKIDRQQLAYLVSRPLEGKQ